MVEMLVPGELGFNRREVDIWSEEAPGPRPHLARLLVRTFRSLNQDEEPDPNGPLAEAWRWLVDQAT